MTLAQTIPSLSPNQLQSRRRCIARILIVLLLLLFLGSAMMVLAVVDLARLGGKEPWSDWDRLRVAFYLNGGAIAGRLIPPIGPLALPHHAFVMADAYRLREAAYTDLMDWQQTSTMILTLSVLTMVVLIFGMAGMVNGATIRPLRCARW